MSDDTVAESRASPTTAPPPPPTELPVVPGYAVLRLIGEGGMGRVYEAIELRFDRRVALKVHAGGADAGLWSEAQLAAQVADPGVVTVLDVGRTADGRAYYAMELVEGTDLVALLRDGPLSQPEALRVAMEIARATAAAHDQGIVHRDLKPANVMLDRSGRVRVLDFGIAIRPEKQTPRASFVGSPPYMAPEQLSGGAVGPETDVHAIGVMLYQMLTGQRPYQAPTTPALLLAILSEVPTPPSRLCAVHPEVERVVLRCLEKEPKARYPNARALLGALAAAAEGQSAPDAAPPHDAPRTVPARVARPERPAREDAERVFRWTWALRSSPEALWPYLADTDRFNEAVGLGPVEVDGHRESRETIAHTGHARALGFSLEWREYPFEWVQNRRHTVFRWYRAGPLEALWNRVELAPRADGGTDLVHEVAVVPRGLVGRVAVAVEIGQRLRRAFDRVYRHVDAVVESGRGHPYDAPHAPSEEQRTLVRAGAERLVADGFAPPIVGRIADALLHAPARALARMRPYELADAWRAPRDAVLHTMLHAAHVGLLELVWDLVCPTCMVSHGATHTLADVHGRGRCAACETEFEQDLCSSVELVLRPHPAIRSTRLATFCFGAPTKRPHVLAQLVLEPGEERTERVPLRSGEYFAAAFGVRVGGLLVAGPMGYREDARVIVSDGAVEARPSHLREGEASITFVNDTREERSVRIERRGVHDRVPAVAALTHPAFAKLFPDQLLSEAELVAVSRLHLLAVTGGTTDELLRDRGEAGACAALREAERAFAELVLAHEGTVLASALDTFVAAFPSGARAARAAMALLGRDGSLLLRAGLHGGRCFALTRQGRVDYWGEVVHRATWLARAASEGELVLSHQAAGEREVAWELHRLGAAPRVDVADAGPYAGRRIVRVRPR